MINLKRMKPSAKNKVKKTQTSHLRDSGHTCTVLNTKFRRRTPPIAPIPIVHTTLVDNAKVVTFILIIVKSRHIYQ